MRLEKLQLVNFRNYEIAVMEFPSRINVLVGANGSGKTNLLDAIHWLSFTKGAFQSQDSLHIRFGENHFLVKGLFTRPDYNPREVACSLAGGRKVVLEDGVPYQKLSEHLGKFPVVFMDPSDTDMVSDGSELRRKFFDSLISQIDAVYLDNLIQYAHALKQRNGLLKMFQETGVSDWDALESYDQILMATGRMIFERRAAFVKDFQPRFNAYFEFLTQSQESPGLKYESELFSSTFEGGLRNSRMRDVALCRTTFGPHRDDYEFLINSHSLRKFGSQGQIKSFVIALKLAQWDVLRKTKGFKPLMLMDDIFDKLDEHRIGQLLKLMREEFGQLFLTDARPERSRELLQMLGVEGNVYQVVSGTVTGEAVRV
jgi:DNA replication and repair protein RecF